MAMSLSYVTIYNAHNGQSLKIPKPVHFHNLQSFKGYLVDSFSSHILDRPESIFLLTSFGIKFNFHIINELSEVYLFDKRLFNQTNDEEILAKYLQQTEDYLFKQLEPKSFFRIESYPSKTLLSPGEFYNKALLLGSRSQEYVARFSTQINVIFKSFNIILQFIANLISGTEKNVNNHLNYVKVLNAKSLHDSWKVHYKELHSLSAVTFKKAPRLQIHLTSYLDEKRLAESAKEVNTILPEIIGVFNGFLTSLNEANEEKNGVDKRIELLRKESMETFKEFEVTKTSSFSTFESLSKELASTVVLNDDRKAKIVTEAEKLFDALASFANFKEILSHEAVLIFQSVAKMQMSMVGTRTEMKKIMSDNSVNDPNQSWKSKIIDQNAIMKVREAENLLSLTVDLPLLFGFMLVEKRRQYEWYDFFSKGIVANVLEQLTGIIDHEKMFQKLWIKKFGSFIHLLNSKSGTRVQVPSIDLSIVNGDNSFRLDSIFSILGDVEVQRDDITSYIENIRSHHFVNNTKFANLLEKNFKDLMISTETLKKITKTVSNLSSITSGDGKEIRLGLSHSHLVGEKSSIEQDLDLNLIKDLRHRIRKLEDLLHQQQFSNLSNWPVIKGPENRPVDNNMSMLLVPQMGKSVTDPTKLLKGKPKLLTDSKGIKFKPLDTSATIDKHLDNIRLRKENSELTSANKRLQDANDRLQNEIAALKEALENEKRRNEQLEVKHEKILSDTITHNRDFTDSQTKIIESQAGELQVMKQTYDQQTYQMYDLQSKYEVIQEEKRSTSAEYEIDKKLWNEERGKLQDQVLELRRSYDNMTDQSSTNQELAQEISDLTAELSDLRTFKTELVSNMQAKEIEFSNERSSFEKQIDDLKLKLETNGEDYENLMEIAQTKENHFERTIAKAVDMMRKLILIVTHLMTRNYKFVEEFCFVLESMGLLLVKEMNSDTGVLEFKIKRVKGLKSKKVDNDNNEEFFMRSHHVQSDIINELGNSIAWIGSVELQLEMRPHSAGESDKESTVNEYEQELSSLISVFEQYFSDASGEPSPFTEFLKEISLNEHSQSRVYSPVADVSEMFFLRAISKRFNDVEGFAKKLTKEIKSKSHEKSKLIEAAKKKIAVNNFEEGDLVLFLPTQIERSSVSVDGKYVTPWTAFNIDATHYFLDIDKKANFGNEEWFVGRITGIERREVTEENAQEKGENPFHLNAGTSWYMVETN